MRIWIDVAPARNGLTFFGLTLPERILRAIARLDDGPAQVTLSGPGELNTFGHDVSLQNSDAPAGQRLADYLRAGDGPVLALDGSALLDNRLLPLLTSEAEPTLLRNGDGPARTAILRLPSDMSVPLDAATLSDIAEQLVTDKKVTETHLSTLPDFVAKLRRNVPFTLVAVTDAAQRDGLERREFHGNYKGSTDFLTKWVYPPIVWHMTKFCARHRIHPNTITAISIFLAFAVVPLFAGGFWFWGLAGAYLMTILDSVDGKLARLTLTFSDIGNILDHGLDIVHPPFWYIAWAYGLGARDLGDPLAIATMLLFAFYIADRLILAVAKARFKRGLHAMTPLDGKIRTWIARRNVNMAIFTLGLLAGAGAFSFVLVTLWQGATFAYHTIRTIWLFPKARHERYLT